MHRGGEGLGPARARRRRLPDRAQVELRAEGRPKPKYLVCNADESEPGTFKDRELIEKNPHLLIEGMILAGWAIQANTGYIYLRGEFELAAADPRPGASPRRARPACSAPDVAGQRLPLRPAHAPRRGRLHLRRGDRAALARSRASAASRG